MTSRETGLCNGIIHSASAAAAAVGGGLAQVPASDNLIITPIQLTMAVSLGKVFGITLEKRRWPVRRQRLLVERHLRYLLVGSQAWEI